MQAFLAILRYDIGQLARSWVARLWLPLLLAPALFLVVVAAVEGELASETMGAYVAAVLMPVSALAIAVLTSNAISGELNVISDGILSRSVTRAEYLWAKIASRIGFTIVVYLAVMVPFAFLMTRYALPDTSALGILGGILVVGVLLVFLGALGIAFSTLFQNSLLSVLVLLLLVLTSGLIFQFLGVRWLSATAVATQLPATFRGDTSAWDMVRVVVVFGGLTAASLFVSLWVFRRRDL